MYLLLQVGKLCSYVLSTSLTHIQGQVLFNYKINVVLMLMYHGECSTGNIGQGSGQETNIA